MFKSPQADRGKWAEDEVQKHLDARSTADFRFAYHRYPDTRAARNFIAKQPSDFLVALQRELPTPRKGTWHLEIKETAEERRLPKAKIGQYGKLKMFWWAGIEPVILVYRSKFNDWVFFTADDLMPFEECPKSFPFGTRRSYPTASDAMKEIFR